MSINEIREKMRTLAKDLVTLVNELESIESFSQIDFTQVNRGEFRLEGEATVLALYLNNRDEPVTTTFSTDGTIIQAMGFVVQQQIETNKAKQQDILNQLTDLQTLLKDAISE